MNRYTLLQVFSKFGKVTKLDYLFHKTGLLKGKPRGYAFIEYGNSDVSYLLFLHLALPPARIVNELLLTVRYLFHSMLALSLATIICGQNERSGHNCHDVTSQYPPTNMISDWLTGKSSWGLPFFALISLGRR